MSRSEIRTREGWASFDRWSLIIAILLALLALLLYFANKGKPGSSDCCGKEAAVAAAPAATPAVAPAVVPAPAVEAPKVEEPKVETPKVETAKVEPVAPAKPAEPVIDCTTIMNGVTVNFAVNGATPTVEGKAALDQVVKCLTAKQYEVAGHTDSDGSDAYNQNLSVRRAASVVAYLKSKGVPANKMTAAGYGESKPIADNTTDEGKAKNRRITFTPK
jgi:OmpA-OmpF porin, OOP family